MALDASFLVQGGVAVAANVIAAFNDGDRSLEDCGNTLGYGRTPKACADDEIGHEIILAESCPCAVFKTASGTGRLLWYGEEDAWGKKEEEKARSRDRNPKGTNGDGAQGWIQGTRACEGAWSAGCRHGQRTDIRIVLQRAVLSRSPEGARMDSSGPGAYPLRALRRLPLVQGLSKPHRQLVRQRHHGQSKRGASP